MRDLLRELNVYEDGKIKRKAVSFSGGSIRVSDNAAAAEELHHCYLFPGFADVHVHLREPGFSYKETIASGTRAAAHGGYTDVGAMPNLDPVPDTLEHLQPQLDAIARSKTRRRAWAGRRDQEEIWLIDTGGEQRRFRRRRRESRLPWRRNSSLHRRCRQRSDPSRRHRGRGS